jgi:DNA-binding NarL/FixJ family response regulator
MTKTKVLLADDHPIVAQGLEALLKDYFDLVGIVHDGRALMDLAEALRPDVIVTDISMPLCNGLDGIREIRVRWPDMKVIVLTMHREIQLALDALRAGASGYMLKASRVEELVTAITQIAEGRAYVTTLLTQDLINMLMNPTREESQGSPCVTPLTPRQREVLQLVAEGHTMREVASILRISPRTAESHKYEIMQTLGVDTTAALIQYAVRLRLV